MSSTRTKSQQGRYVRTKGHNFERQVARMLQVIFPNAKRGTGQSRGGGKEVADITGTPFHIECKVGARPNIMGAMRQALADTDGKPPLVITKKDGQEPLVTMKATTFTSMCSQYAQLAQEGRLNPEGLETLFSV